MALHLVATVTLGTTTWRLARESFTLVDDDGDRVEVLGHWEDPSISLELELLQIAEPPSVTIDGAYLPDLDKVLVRHAWTEGRGEVALVDDTASWDARAVLIAGVVTDAQTLPGSVAAFTISANVEPPPSTVGAYVVSAERWSQSASAAEGAPGPLIFGTPGAVVKWDGTAVSYPGSPAPYVDGVNRRVLFAAGVVEEGDVTVHEPSGGSTTTVTVSHRTDSLNDRVATGVLPNSSPWNDSSLSFYVAWDDTSRGIIREAAPGGPVLGVGDLCLWLLRRSSVRWDRGRWRTAAEQLNVVRVAAAIEQPVDPWLYLIDAVLPLVPVSLIVGAQGVYPLVHRVDPTDLDVEYRFTFVDPKATSTPAIALVECLGDAVTGAWTPTHRIRYGWDSAAQEYRREVTVSGDIARRADADVITTVHSLRAGARHLSAQVGREYPEAMPEALLETDLLTENRSAHLVALWRSALLSAPQRRLRYAMGAEAVVEVPRLLGAICEVTDGDRDLSGKLARIEGVELVATGPSPVILTLSILDPYDTAT